MRAHPQPVLDHIDAGLAYTTVVTILTRQRDHANDRNQNDRATLFTDLLNNLDKPD